MALADISTLEKFRAQVGKEVVVTEWVEMSQERIDLFAKATGDLQWIHVDPQRAAAESPFGGAIAHGFLTLSLLGKFYQDDIDLPFCDVGINYGLHKVRFTNPVRAGSRVLGQFRQAAALGKVSRPEHIASAVCWLLEPDSMVTGQLIPVEAGILLGRPPSAAGTSDR
jgi:acyl dehydratase